jgi:hypothetical protein
MRAARRHSTTRPAPPRSRSPSSRRRRADAQPGAAAAPAGAFATLAVLRPDELRSGLWRWTAPHPEWQPAHADGSPTDWPRDVGCVLYETDGHAVFFDPLAAADEREFWGWADARCEGREVAVLETIRFHRRSRDEFAARYDAAAVAPAGVVAYHFALAEETVYWLPHAHTLIPGDTLIERDGALSLCPASWLEYLDTRPTRAAVAAALRELCALDIELVLVSHGEPVAGDARAALAHALEAA